MLKLSTNYLQRDLCLSFFLGGILLIFKKETNNYLLMVHIVEITKINDEDKVLDYSIGYILNENNYNRFVQIWKDGAKSTITLYDTSMVSIDGSLVHDFYSTPIVSIAELIEFWETPKTSKLVIRGYTDELCKKDKDILKNKR